MRAPALLALLGLAACGEAPDAAGPAAHAPPSDAEIAEACGKLVQDQHEAFAREAGPSDFEDAEPAAYEVRASACTLVAAGLAECAFEMSWSPLDHELPRDRLDWHPARGRFRYLGRRLLHPRWYPADEAACRGRGG
jgi:hypothetical protein